MRTVGFGPVAGVVVAIALLSAMAVSAQEVHAGIDLEQMLAQPGVKLVAVEFWADWCKPCVKALPKWKKLHRKYRDRGFRLIMVAVSSKDGRCGVPGWVPDRKVCDEGEDLAVAWHATELPQAFLWTWQGTLLMEHASFDEVQRAVERWFQDQPRILVESPVDSKGEQLPDGDSIRKLIRVRLAEQGRFELVAFEDELAEIRKLRALGYQASYDESTRCSLGRDVSPNMSLKPQLLDAQGERNLVLQLFSLEKGCLIGSSRVKVPNEEGAIVSAVLEGASALHAGLTGKPAAPSEWVGAGGEIREETRDGETYVPPFGTLTVRTAPEGARVFVNGTPVGRTPVKDVRVPATQLQVRLVADRFLPEVIEGIVMKPGKSLDILRTLRARAEGAPLKTLQASKVDSGSQGGFKQTPVGVSTAPKRGARSLWPWLMAGTGGAAVVGGVIMLVWGQALYDNVEEDPGSYSYGGAQNEWELADSLNTGGWIALGLGGALMVGGTLWGLQPSEDPPSTSVSLLPMPGGGAAVGLGGTF